MADDPLEAIEQLPQEAQMAVVISVLRSTRASQTRIEKKLDWLNRALWTLITTIIAGVIVYSVTVAQRQAPQRAKSHAAFLSTRSLP